MKYIFYIFFCFFFVSCSNDFLDRNPLDKPSNEGFWNTEKDAIAAATGCYNGWFSMDEVLYFDCASDNAYSPFPWEGWTVHGSGYATPTDYGYSRFSYSNITRCNNFLENISRPKMDEKLRSRLTAEVRFLRVWDYFWKVVLYGDVPLVTDVLTIDESDRPRNPKSEVIEFMLNELSEIIPSLDIKYEGDNVGRITRGAAMTLKARILLFEKRYKECAEICNEIFSLGYRLFDSYDGLFRISNENNPEVILDVQYLSSLYSNWVLGVLLPNSVGGWASINPLQSLVDSYECVDGKTIDESPLFDKNEPYKNRDHRLEVTLLCPGDLYCGKYYNPIDKNDPNGDYYAPYGRSKTAYLVKKYVNNPDDYSDIWDTGMNAIVMRYAEVLLMYAESKIELNDVDESVYQVLNQIRQRAGLPEVDRAVYSNQSKLRELLRRERRVELAMEGLRWFDICRWQIAEDVMNGRVYGALLGTVNPDNGELNLTDERIEVETRIFDPSKNYLWPIPQNVIDATTQIKQNPGY